MAWTNVIQIGQTFDDNEGLTGRLTVALMSGVQRNKLFAGLALGFGDYGDFNIGSVALYSKYRLLEKGVSPYGYASFGYGRPTYFKDDNGQDTARNTNGGLLYETGIGIDIPLGNAILLVQLGYRFQKITYDEPNYYYYSNQLSNFAPYGGDAKHTIRKINRIEFKLGIQF
jgi:hypothetical protein